MKNRLLISSVLACLALPWAAAQAQEVGRVISSTPLISQVSVPRQVCAQEIVQTQNAAPAAKSGAGALMGGIAGGAMGNAVGQGSGRAAATVIGLFAGAILGDKIEGGNSAGSVTTSQQTVNRCSTQNIYENRTTGYQVVYEYAGKQYSVQLPQDPGPTIQLQVTPAAAVQQSVPQVQVQPPAAPVQVISQAPVQTYIVQEPQVVSQVIYTSPVVVAPTYYHPQPAFNTSFVIRSGGHRHHGYRPGHGVGFGVSYGSGAYWR